jgi:hypothetical protein
MAGTIAASVRFLAKAALTGGWSRDAEKEDERAVYHQQGCCVEVTDMLADVAQPDTVEQIDCRPGWYP